MPKITYNLPVKVWEVLKAMAEEDQISKTEALRRTISTEAFRRAVTNRGGEIMVKNADGSFEKVNFPY